MPLTMARTGETMAVLRVGGRAETRKFLESLGFVAGGMVTVVADMGGNLIVSVKDARVALSREMAAKILI